MPDSFTALYVAYSIVWLGVFGYLLYMHVRQRKVESDIKLLREELSRHGK